MSFQQGLSGLNAASKALDVTSNNVSNSATVGFKSASAHFADVFAASIGGGGASQVGIGISVGAIQQQFTQGNITSTNNPLDISINGGGFFRMSSSGAVTYSRNGQFHLDKEGYVVDDKARKLTGYQAVDGTVSGALGEVKIDNSQINPVLTGKISIGANLDSRLTAPLPADALVAGTLAGTAPDFDAPAVTSYNTSTSLSIFDSLGNPHVETFYFVKDSTAPNSWNVLMTIDNGKYNGGAVTQVATLGFDTSGVLNAPLGPPVGSVPALPDIAWDAALGVAPQPVSFDFSGSTQFGSSFSVNKLEQDGYTTGRLSGISIGIEGVIRGNYTNGQAKDLGQVVLTSFANTNGLQSLGGNQWAETSESGPALVGAPNTGSLGVLQSAAVEESNVDLTAELVNMITQQRNYQANAQSIKTQDQIMQTLVNLR